VAAQGKLYAIGGDNNVILDVVEAYDPTTNGWSTKAHLNHARTQIAVAELSGKVYAIGGISTGTAQTQWGPPVATCEVYDPQANSWSDCAPMPTARSNAAAVGFRGLVYVIGGGGAGTNGGGIAVEAFDPSHNVWTTEPKVSTSRESLAAIATSSSIYAIGGVMPGQPPVVTNVVERFGCLDEDGDGLCDDWEVNGVPYTDPIDHQQKVLDLRALGANPKHKDIFVQLDYMEGLDAQGVFHSHRPRAGAIQLVIDAFGAAPVDNPDHKPGIYLHVDCGTNCVADPVVGDIWGRIDPTTNHTYSYSGPRAHSPYINGDSALNLADLKTSYRDLPEYFPQGRRGVFHYALFAHQQNQSVSPAADCNGHQSTLRSSGIADLPGADLIVSLGCGYGGVGTTWQQAGALMHELGHNLGLHHGGGDDVNFKPNYLSVMNYWFNLSGLLRLQNNGTTATGMLDYSRWQLPDLVETSLNEGVGLAGGTLVANYGTYYWGTGCNAPSVIQPGTVVVAASSINGPIDWNCNGVRPDSLPVAAAISNQNGNGTVYTYPLHGSNDWCTTNDALCPNSASRLSFSAGTIGLLGAAAGSLPTGPAADELLTPQLDNEIVKPWEVRVAGGGVHIVAPGSILSLVLAVTNNGMNADTYDISTSSTLPWADFSTVPNTVALGPGETAQFSIKLTVPASASTGSTTRIALTATSHVNGYVVDSAEADIWATPNGAPAFLLTVAPGSQTVAGGQTATFAANVTPVGGSTQTVALACAGTPSPIACSVDTTMVTLNGASTETTTVRVIGPMLAATAVSPWYTTSRALKSALGLIVILFVPLTRQKRRSPRIRTWVRVAVAMVGLPFLAACGGGGGGQQYTMPTTYTLTITATAGALVQTSIVKLTVT
jgi:hypothetical protein